jgi:Peptidase C39 family
MRELKSIAASHGFELIGLWLSVSQLKEIPLPAIVQIDRQSKGDLGHYWVLETLTQHNLKIYDPQSRRRFSQTTSEFSQEWGGNALVFGHQKKLPGVELSAHEMSAIYGGCCTLAPCANDLGEPDDPDTPDHNSCGAPQWSINKVNFNFFAKDIPLWYRCPIGPPVQIALSYNSQSSIAQYEPFGNKWQFNYGTYLVEDSSGNVKIFMPNGL